MSEQVPSPAPEPPDAQAEIVRLNKILQALMDRSERSTSAQGSDFSMFERTIMLEEQVRRRTADLEGALRENEKVNRALRESEGKFRGLVSQSLVGIVLIEDGKFTYSNNKFDDIFGYSAEEVRELEPLTTAAESDRVLVAENIAKRLSGETDQLAYMFHGLRKNGELLDIECHSSVMREGASPVLISLFMDVTERAQADRDIQALQEELRQQATRDSLTGLYNRRFLDEFFARELLLAERSGDPLSVIMVDLDYFKEVNDRYGHLAGDQALRVLGDLMLGRLRATDIVCRYGGEEFLLVLPGTTEDSAVERAEGLRRAMAATTVRHGASRIRVTASLGVATFPHHGGTRDTLIAAADSALYEAKAGGRNRDILSSVPTGHTAETTPALRANIA